MVDLIRQLAGMELHPKAPCNCQYCMLQYRADTSDKGSGLKYIGSLEPGEAARVAASYTRSITQDRDYIRRMVCYHGDTLLKKWQRDRKGRRKMLEKADLDIYMFRTSMIDIQTRLYSNSLPTSSELSTERQRICGYLLPYVNIKNLVRDPSKLIRLLHYRSHYAPQDSVPFDNSVLQPAWKQGLMVEQFADGCITAYGSAFGEWRDFMKAEVHRADAYGAPRGLLLLET